MNELKNAHELNELKNAHEIIHGCFLLLHYEKLKGNSLTMNYFLLLLEVDSENEVWLSFILLFILRVAVYSVVCASAFSTTEWKPAPGNRGIRVGLRLQAFKQRLRRIVTCKLWSSQSNA